MVLKNVHQADEYVMSVIVQTALSKILEYTHPVSLNHKADVRYNRCEYHPKPFIFCKFSLFV